MKHKVRYMMLRLTAVFLLFYLMFACANIGNPNGGPYDEDPPEFVASNPAINQLRFDGKKIEVFFDEYITLESPSENVIVTPPQKQNPFIQGIGKKILVELKDTLKENTTYTIDFTSSITDNNEKNVLENFSFAFSTGDVLDTLQISGTLINAEDLEPVQRMLVGIHNDLSDTAFTKTPFLRTSKTDERGRFTIHNVSPGTYHLFAVEDKNRNYAYDKNNDEALAFFDSVIIPSCERGMVPDTVWRDTITFDTVLMVEKTLFYPNDLVLWFSKDSITPRQRLLRPERPQDYIFTLKFNAPMDTFPVPVPLNFEPRDSLWYVTQRGESQEGFSINYWILDSMIYKIDTLLVGVNYWKNNDTIPDLIELQTDTLTLVNKDAAQKKKKKTPRKKPPKVRPDAETSADSLNTEEAKTPVIPLQVAVTPSGSMNPHDIISVKFNEPVMDVRKEFFMLELGVDTLWEAVDFELGEDPVLAMTYNIVRPFNYEETYRLTIDSAMLYGVYGHCNDSISVTMTVKSEKEYGHLTVAIQGLPAAGDMPIAGNSNRMPDAASSIPAATDSIPDAASASIPEAADSIPDAAAAAAAAVAAAVGGNTVPAFMELLNSSGLPVAKAIVENGIATFRDMPAEKYYARLILDTNG
ncbi:MAG: Ig-like domain-containing protein, partial [Tannerella sp.]|nr:Ig-like domain-containing protein [Tannerella sp.]